MDVQHEDKKGKKIVSNHWKPNKTYKSVLKGSKERNGLHHCQDGLNIMWMPHLIQYLVWQVWGLLLLLDIIEQLMDQKPTIIKSDCHNNIVQALNFRMENKCSFTNSLIGLKTL
jgi:hypothetical protein